MAYNNNNNRYSTYSTVSAGSARPSVAPASAQVSTQTLLNALHTCYTSRTAYPLESSSSLVVNTWVTSTNVGPDGRYGGTVDVDLARRVWEHARRRAEDGCVILGSLHESTPTMLAPFISAIPINLPPQFYTALDVLRPLTHCVTPFNPSYARYSALAVTFTCSLNGPVTDIKFALSKSGIDVQRGLLNIPAQAGYRAFDVFYYLDYPNASRAERDALALKSPSAYTLLRRSGTFSPPNYLPTVDDAASAESWRQSLADIGVTSSQVTDLVSTLAGLLKLGDSLNYLVDEETLHEVCDDAAELLDIDADVLRQKIDTVEREIFIAGMYEALVDWVIARANASMRAGLQEEMRTTNPDGTGSDRSGIATPDFSVQDGNSVSITVVDVPGPDLGKAIALRTVFDDTEGINAEMKEDGVTIDRAGTSVLREMKAAGDESAADIGLADSAKSRDREVELDRREGVLEKVLHLTDDHCFARKLLQPVQGQGVLLGNHGRMTINDILGCSRSWFQLNLHPTDELPPTLAPTQPTASAWSASSVSRQLRAWRLPEWANRRNKNLDFTADFDIAEFVSRYAPLGCKEGKDGIDVFVAERGWSNGDVVVGKERVWLREHAWWQAEETLLSMPGADGRSNAGVVGPDTGLANQSGFFGNPFNDIATLQGSRDNLLDRHYSSATLPADARSVLGGAKSPAAAKTMRSVSGGDYGLGKKGDVDKGDILYEGVEIDPNTGNPIFVETVRTSTKRNIWVFFVRTITFPIPSFLLSFLGRMKTKEIRLAWREKLVLVMIIFLINAIIVFYIVAFGKLLCPQWDKAWNAKEVGYHQGNTDFWVSHHGKVYDMSKFWKTQHSDTSIKTTEDQMQPFGGQNIDNIIQPPLNRACPRLVTSDRLTLQSNNTPTNPSAIHTSGFLATDITSALHDVRWYENNFLPKMETMYKGDLVVDPKVVKSEGENQNHPWVIINDKIYDLTDYFYTLQVFDNYEGYEFLDPGVQELISGNYGLDITDEWAKTINHTTSVANMQCLDLYFYAGKTDFRLTAKCQANNYILLAFTIILCAVILVKFLAALQLGSKKRPAMQEKFVICQVPAYTEGEEHLRKGLDSLATLHYDNKKKLICVICDGMVIGGGNDRPTPKIVLDILGVDPKTDPPALPFKSVGMANEQLNYGKVYSGLYEFEGNVVPYLVVVKVGKESEQNAAKPGNRGKRDSQILLMSFLNRVHHRGPMNPLELEMFHQLNNIIGVDPELYEYLFMVDADTCVKEDALNRLVAACANDAKIAGICGETSLENEERSWWTMIQVYEYYISHHLAKAFESLFGSVTCLPGCFCMYRLRTADKGKPLIISDALIKDYSDCNVDTLHKKNLLSLGEDRYLTTLMTKYFPAMSYKFVPDAYALTAAPETWSILLSQRRRWINSTIHNLAELVFLKDLCGFCCFSMRFVVFIDLFGTLILPATCAYLAYLIYNVATGQGQFPLISIIMLAAVYGLQAVIFLIKRKWQHIGWMIIYIIAFPIYSFVLPIYSFWKQDDFSWGFTRRVVNESGGLKTTVTDFHGSEPVKFDPRTIPLQRWDDYAAMNNLPGRRGQYGQEKDLAEFEGDHPMGGEFEMDDIRSQYSGHPASTILTGFGFPGHAAPAQSPGPYAGMQQRHSQYSNLNMGYTDHPNPTQEHLMSMGGMSRRQSYFNQGGQATPGADPFSNMHRASTPGLVGPVGSPHLSQADLLGAGTPPMHQQNPHMSTTSFFSQGAAQRARSPLGFNGSRPVSTVNFQNANTGPDDATIVAAVRECLKEVDMDSVTKKMLKALAEQRLQTTLQGERKQALDGIIDVELANM
ncbi:glycosyltransferase family 2 protein [Aulographum hederae CBS 113979]|uniref:chitin synthase n=1 Tax=Aulographum hederae CBS 113979 TaxID=1176131 RepID=A0A6G1HH79_9PEZI|nr:glycosyltransferase family 2 protein [Aulographum hederae CBS 113979]